MIISAAPEQQQQQHTTPSSSAHSDSSASAPVAPSDKCGSTAGARPNMAPPADTRLAVAGLETGSAGATHDALRDSGELQQQRAPLPSQEQQQQQQTASSSLCADVAPAPTQQPEHHAKVAAPAGHQQQQQQTDSGDDSWTPGQPQSSADMDCDQQQQPQQQEGDDEEEQEESWDGCGAASPWRFCTNCTARLHSSDCSDCGHNSDNDAALFDCVSSQQPVAAAAAGSSRPVLVWDDEMLLHDEGKDVPHPERPDRLRAIMARLTGSGLASHCERVPARPASQQELLRVHTADHLRRLQLFCSGTVEATSIPSDTYINVHTLRCAALAAGSAAEVAVRVAGGAAACGAAIIRPPGHHAESNTAMGFCFFNNAAVAARAAQAAGAERVLILDWDVHHGNGTQHIFEDDPSVLYMSLHRYDRGAFYPGTGAADEVGIGRGAGYSVNVPWDAAGIGNGDYLAAMQQVLLPVAREFAPDLVIISAGFDAADGDPIGGCRLSPDCFAAMTAQLMAIAPTALLLEGGYNLSATAASTEACLRVLLGEAPEQQGCPRPSPFGWLAIQAAKKAHSRYWSCLAGAFPQLAVQQAAGGAAAGLLQRLIGFGCGSRAVLEYGDDYEEPDYMDDEEEDEQEGDQAARDDDDDDGSRQPHGWGFGTSAGRQQGGNRHSHTGHSDAAAATATGLGMARASDGDVHSSRRRQQPGRGGGGWRPAQPPQQLHQQRRRRQQGLSRKQQILRAIHKRAMAVFWRRRLRRSGSHQQQQQRQQQQQL